MSAAAVVNTCPTPAIRRPALRPGGGKTVALTFDDGPGASTQAILDILRQYNVTATFFNIGVNETVRPRPSAPPTPRASCSPTTRGRTPT